MIILLNYIINIFSDLVKQIRNEADEVTNVADLRAWDKKNGTATYLLFASMTKEAKSNLYNPGLTAAQIWAKVILQYELSTEEEIHLLWQQYYDFGHTKGYIFQS